MTLGREIIDHYDGSSVTIAGRVVEKPAGYSGAEWETFWEAARRLKPLPRPATRPDGFSRIKDAPR